MGIFWNLVIFLSSFLFSIVLTSLTIPFANKHGFIHAIYNDKSRLRVAPRIGGIGFIVPFLLFIILGKLDGLPNHISVFPGKVFGLIVIGLLILITLGILDDKYGLSAVVKVPVQVIVSALLVSSGLIFDFRLFADPTFNLTINIAFTLFWILLLINSINIIDGLDCLACMVAINILFFLIIFDVLILGGNSCSMQLGVLISCLLGFRFFNKYPAKTYMGDTGSTFLGAILAIYTLQMGLPGRVTSMLTIPIILFLFPFFDVFCTVLRRTMIAAKGVKKEPVSKLISTILTGDREHIHYRILEIDGNHKRTVRILCLINFTFGIISVLYFYSAPPMKYLILFLLLIIMLYSLEKLRYLPLASFGRLLFKMADNIRIVLSHSYPFAKILRHHRNMGFSKPEPKKASGD